jgi:hypothetical protein
MDELSDTTTSSSSYCIEICASSPVGSGLNNLLDKVSDLLLTFNAHSRLWHYTIRAFPPEVNDKISSSRTYHS